MAAFSTALASLLAQAELLEVEEDFSLYLYRPTGTRFRPFVLRTLGLAFTATRYSLRCTCAFRALSLPRLNSSAVSRVSRENPFVFGGLFLSTFDSDFVMNK